MGHFRKQPLFENFGFVFKLKKKRWNVSQRLKY